MKTMILALVVLSLSGCGGEMQRGGYGAFYIPEYDSRACKSGMQTITDNIKRVEE